MSSKLYSLYTSYQKSGIDDSFIDEAFNLIMQNEKGLDDFVTNYSLIDEDEDEDKRIVLGRYSIEDKKVMINRGAMNDPDVEVGVSKKMLVLQTLKHEIEHARSYQRLYERREDIESMIVRFSIRDYAYENGLDRWDPLDKTPFFLESFRAGKEKNYEIDPGERLVDIKGWRFVVDLLKNQRSSRDLMIARNMLFYAYRRGYRKGFYLDAPTYQFLLNTGMYHQFYLLKKQVEEKKHYSFDTRITYGLPVTEKEYNNDILRKVKLWK